MNIWIIGKALMKLHCMNKKIFTVTLTWKILVMQITSTEREFVKILR